MSNNKVSNRDIDDLVFEHRNKAYGAFSLRKLYPQNMTKGMVVGFSAFLLLIATPVIYAKYQEYLKAQQDELLMKEVVLAEPPPIDPKKPPPPPPPKIDPPPIKDQIKFVPPVVKKDDEVVDEDPPPIIEDLKDKELATETKEGDEDGVDASLVEPEAPPPPPPPVIEEPEETFNTANVQQKPMFPDGEAALFKYLSENIKYPAVAKDNGIQGTVVLSFVVSKTGNIEDVQVVRELEGGCSAEAVRVVRGMPNWTPGKNNGKPVKVKYTLPVKFKLQE
jgi:periplasmic protein TonB